MANTRGGFIVIGVSEQPAGYSFDGVSSDQAETFDTTRVNRFLQTYADPPINALLRKVSHDGKVFVIIEVPAFPDTPHICQQFCPHSSCTSAPTTTKVLQFALPPTSRWLWKGQFAIEAMRCWQLSAPS
jgi:predicted HTH transcriptional regulator